MKCHIPTGELLDCPQLPPEFPDLGEWACLTAGISKSKTLQNHEIQNLYNYFYIAIEHDQYKYHSFMGTFTASAYCAPVDIERAVETMLKLLEEVPESPNIAPAELGKWFFNSVIFI